MQLATADYDLTAMAMDPNARMRENPDSRLRVSFFMHPEQDMDRTAKEGRPIFLEKEYIQIMVPGERDVVVRPAWSRDYERFPQQYQAFKNKQNQDAVSGTPLAVLTFLSKAQVKELEYFNCMTVEQLASMPDSTAQKFMQINKLKQLAKDYIQAAKETAPLTSMRAEMEDKDNRISVLERQISELIAASKEEASKKESKK
jgi:hypothetical protein